ncbi:hypothetical protein DM01DRAFT_1315581 [Hesseltinella vesiculosa]|uniref:DUF7082 domain-containing protein n=1 Tax=Hesseltinella vesiculosa TaxID=101127 RepID=A0A1X2GX47_9FUNG|nr:hypothetical protein DM01DRAFT_1315581 [Hesseltinella vesiculosa]
MTQDWQPMEWRNGRRLVRFRHDLVHNKLLCTFYNVLPHPLAEDHSSTVVSCIYWVERDDYFITSVDCIHLLESLLETRFTVDEKNRVRRNLEGFHPITVSKSRPDTSDFFKLVMSFPIPKPRNIEKDVKVFPWKSLPYVLKKITTKYSAIDSAASSSALLNPTLLHPITPAIAFPHLPSSRPPSEQ